jgi:hypothetical protein
MDRYEKLQNTLYWYSRIILYIQENMSHLFQQEGTEVYCRGQFIRRK